MGFDESSSMPGRICPECDTFSDGDVCPRCGTRTLFDTPSEPGFDPLLGRVFDGRYRLESQLGKGGMGVVYRAVQIAMGKEVAVKVLRGELASHREAARRFHREAKAASLLSHPHTVRVFDFGQTRDRELFMVMEYLEGRTLGHLLAEYGRLPAARAATIVAEIAEALLEAHAKGLVHRDLKPDNVILLDLTGHPDFVKVLDFGIAKLLADSGQGSDVTRTGAMIGTPKYMAPEQVQGSRSLSPALDIYALGVVLYEALAGAPPFRGDTPLEVVMAHVNQPVPELPDDVDAPGEVRGLLRAMLAKEPASRPDAAEVFEVLTDVRLRALTAGFDELEASAPGARRWPWLAVGIGALLLATLLLVTREGPAPGPEATPAPTIAAPLPDAHDTHAAPAEVVEPTEVDSPNAEPTRQGLDVTPEKRERMDATSKEPRQREPRSTTRGQPRAAKPAEPPAEPSKPKYEPVW